MSKINRAWNSMGVLHSIVMAAYILVSSVTASMAVNDSIGLSQYMSDGETLVSKNGLFELGFFRPGNSTKCYLGIWYKKMAMHAVVWVANRVDPINGFSGKLTMDNTGNLILKNNGSVVWSTASQREPQNPVAQLMDSGNLVIWNGGGAESDDILWQSFDYPTDTYLPGMKIGRDLRNGSDWRLTSWKSVDDPSPGDFSWGLALSDYPEFAIMNGTKKFSRIGPWNGMYFSGLPNVSVDSVIEFNYVANQNEIYYTSSSKNDSIISRVVINQTSKAYSRYVWVEKTHTWSVFESLPSDVCDNYGHCGAYGICIATAAPVCLCLNYFRPKSPEAWNSSNWAQGCVRNEPLSCTSIGEGTGIAESTDEFVKHSGLKLPDTQHTRLVENVDIHSCSALCLNNCSCMAYTNSDISGGGSGCVMWFGNLIDIKLFDSGGQDLNIRMPASKLEKSKIQEYMEGYVNDADLPLFDLLTINIATDKFSFNNKIGQGGFGPVYKGKLEHGQEIAVKRLSHSSRQGMAEFITEVKLIAKLQHRNLVKLLGCCIQGEEKLLVYEYVVNGSLDTFIFDQAKSNLLDWPRRFLIIFGVARGLLYLHQDSRLRIIHRDLKASNILLDDKLNPKISDFGMARTFGGDQTEGNTNRVVGTYGYMAPEYAIDGLYSIKSDVFSFGILIMEIICGTKNRALCHANQTLNLIGYAWRVWKEEKALELIDSSIKESCVISEALRCIHVSLLCVQQYPEDRPTMASVILMLGSEMDLVEPKEPGFFPKRVSIEANSQPHQCEVSTNDELTVTSLDGR
ncbi:G-type lectin S-receptor-like serine/threonine-protein kinase At4g27290 isoform X2 [Arachis stenosperma]|uniref:G-type lectin S-receptor-like serine/threonine-protein kinase At4g27290 isoform X2 n=1 Tax=Arachis stenosperma TaxID=217475 RepID=UPI0025AB7139|nr:G-type lectin S-receptor-like serine/threonine-protein kinase At4g27290 isoform X2 [Arachis stenosperma]